MALWVAGDIHGSMRLAAAIPFRFNTAGAYHIHLNVVSAILNGPFIPLQRLLREMAGRASATKESTLMRPMS